MILMRENLLLGPLKGVGPENLDFSGPKWHSLCSLLFQGPKKSRFSGSTPSNGPEMDFPASKSLRPVPYKQQVVNSYFDLQHGILRGRAGGTGEGRGVVKGAGSWLIGPGC
jgi:hypothetical protein